MGEFCILLNINVHMEKSSAEWHNCYLNYIVFMSLWSKVLQEFYAILEKNISHFCHKNDFQKKIFFTMNEHKINSEYLWKFIRQSNTRVWFDGWVGKGITARMAVVCIMLTRRIVPLEFLFHSGQNHRVVSVPG